MRDITDLIVEAQRNLSAVTNNPVHSVDLNLYRDVLDALEAVTVPTENEREALYKVFRDWSNRTTSLETITKSNDETLADAILVAGFRLPAPVEPTRVTFAVHSRKSGKTQQMIDQLLDRANERGITVEIVEPVAPEWEYRRRIERGGSQPDAIFEAMPVLDDGFWAQRRSVGEWEDVPPDEVTEGTQ